MNKIILGIDEVGRGPWAGPMVVGACVLGDAEIDGLDDSKKLSAKKREKLALEIKEKATAVATGWVTSNEIDELGLSDALKLAARRALTKINCAYDQIIIDGTIKLIDDPRVTTLPKADSLIKAVSAASIVAKVARDMYMTKLGEKYPQYGFEKHMGYGTKLHSDALKKFGPCPEHRASFRPVAEVASLRGTQRRGNPYEPEKTGLPHFARNDSTKTTKEIGDSAEDIAAEHLANLGHQILERNWKTKICEIDIVSSYNEVIYFTEVKYRQNDRFGGGADAIDEKKEKQIRFAAKVYMEFNKLEGKIEAKLSVVALSGKPPKIDQYIVLA
jgi:ribonuclease HII